MAELHRADIIKLLSAGQPRFEGLDLGGTDLHGLDLHGVSFDRCNLSRANFEDANISSASFVGATADNANFTGTGGFARLLLARAASAEGVTYGDAFEEREMARIAAAEATEAEVQRLIRVRDARRSSRTAMEKKLAALPRVAPPPGRQRFTGSGRTGF